MTLIGRCVTPLTQSFAERRAIGSFRYHGERALLPGQVIDGFLQLAGNSFQTGLHDLYSQTSFSDAGKGCDKRFGALIKGGVQGIAPATGNHDIRLCLNDRTGFSFYIIARTGMRLKKIPAKGPDDPFFMIHDKLEAEINTGKPGHGQRLFMTGVPLEQGNAGLGVREKFIPVKVLDGLHGGEAGTQRFAPA